MEKQENIKLPDPKHIDTLTRNERIYEVLLKMGLVAIPNYNELGSIRFFWVSTGLIAPEFLKGNPN